MIYLEFRKNKTGQKVSFVCKQEIWNVTFRENTVANSLNIIIENIGDIESVSKYVF